MRDLGKQSLFFLCRGILGFNDLNKAIHEPVCRALQDYEKNPKLIITLPRDWFKSSIGSIGYPIWRGLDNPNSRGLVVQNSFSNACKKLQAIKQIFEKNAIFRALYPEVLPDKTCRWATDCLTVKRSAAHPEGTYEAAGTGTAVTSRHYDYIIEDDTVAPEKDAMKGLIQQPTQLEIEKAIGWHRVATPLQLHPTKSQRVVIGTRWTEGDLIGWIRKFEPAYKVMEVCAETDDGEVVWDRFDRDTLTQIEQALGPYMYSALYLNKPLATINQVFQRSWIQYYSTFSKMEGARLIYCTSVDPAASDAEGSSDPDYNVVLTTGVDPKTGHVYVAKISRARMNPGELINAILDHQAIFKPVVVKIESIAYQRTINYWLRRTREKLGRRFYVEEVKHGRVSKVDRIRALQPYFADGLVHIRPTMCELERELLSFPRGTHDDIIDALAMQIGFWNSETQMRKDEEDKRIASNIFSGASIIDELLGRTTKLNTYPHDIGHMRERAEAGQLRKYSFNDS